MISSTEQWVFERLLEAIPPAPVRSVVEWAEKHVRLPGSARSEAFDSSVTPWTREPIERGGDSTLSTTLVKPIQSGGSTLGEVVLEYWLSTWPSGDICYYWPSNEAADDRWNKVLEKRFQACGPLMERAPRDHNKWTTGHVAFDMLNFVMQGVHSDRSVATDSFRGLVNEEIHVEQDGWLPGRLQQVYGRASAYWNKKIFNISNAGFANGQLHTAFKGGTQQHWQVRCPHCGRLVVARTKWDENEPHLGGLRYDATDARLGNGEYNYSKIMERGLYLQLPCGCCVSKNLAERRKMNRHGQYSEPTNPGASLLDRSYTYDSVIVDFSEDSWLELIQQKHLALRAFKRGNPKPLIDYSRERECVFWDVTKHRPVKEAIVLTLGRKKSREGMPLPTEEQVGQPGFRELRAAAVDYQQGLRERNETEHYWLCIQDWDGDGNSLIVWEGKCADQGEVVAMLDLHVVDPCNVVVDASKNQRYVAAFCLKHGYHAVKIEGSKDSQVKYYHHEDGSEHVYSTPEPLWRIESQPDWSDSPSMFFKINKWGAMERLENVRHSKELKYEVPDDVSEDFKKHFNAWERKERRAMITNEIQFVWNQVGGDDDHLFQCCAYLVTLAEQAELIGLLEAPPQTEQSVQPAESSA